MMEISRLLVDLAVGNGANGCWYKYLYGEMMIIICLQLLLRASESCLLLLVKAFLVFASCRPPATRVNDKVMIPQDEYPEINFVGLLIGPR